MEKAIYDYIEAWYDKDVDRIKRAMHPQLIKQGINPEQSGGIRSIDLQELLEVVPQYGGQSGSERVIQIDILESLKSIATAKMVSDSYTDYIHLVKMKEGWKIINVLWDFRNFDTVEHSPLNEKALEKPLRDYVEGWYEKDVNRIAGCLHPKLAKRSINAENPDQIDQFTYSSLIDVVLPYGGPGGDESIFEMKILDFQKNIASVKVISNAFIDYIHLCFVQGEWKIINVLWEWK